MLEVFGFSLPIKGLAGITEALRRGGQWLEGSNFLHPFLKLINQFNKYLLSTNYVPGTQGRETSVNKAVKTKQNPCFYRMDILVQFATSPQFPDSEHLNHLGLSIL